MPTNLVPSGDRSDFTTTSGTWGNSGTTSTSTTVTEDTGNNRHILYGATFSPAAGYYQTSFEIAQGTARYALVQIADGSAAYTAIFDLQTGTITDTHTVGTVTSTSATITAVGGGYYSCAVFRDHPGGTAYPTIGFSNAAVPTYDVGGTVVYTGTSLNVLAKNAFFGIPDPAAPILPSDTRLPPAGARAGNLLRTWLDPVKLTLAGKDNTLYGPGNQPEYDWPVPKGRTPATSLKTWAESFKLLLLSGKDTFFASAGIGPDYDWPNPQAKRPRSTSLLSITGIGLALASAVPSPVLNVQWPVPQAPRASIDLRTHLDPLKLNLAGKDSFFSGAGIGPDYDYPNPRAPQRAAGLGSIQQSGSLGLTAIIVPVPVVNPHAANPSRRPGAAPGLLTLASAGLQTAAVATPPPPAALVVDWPTPKGARQPVELKTSISYIIDGWDSFQPQLNFDWPNPQAPRRASDLRSLVSSGLALTVIPPPRPPACYDWPVPRGRIGAISLRTFSSAGLQSAVVAPIVMPAGALTDWPNPRGAVPAIATRTSISYITSGWDSLQSQLNYDWPNPPKAAPRSVDLLTAINSGLTVPPAPNVNLQWPVPPGARPSISLRTWIEPTKLLLIGKDAFYVGPGNAPDFDWPNPKGPRASISLLTWSDPLKQHLASKDAFPLGIGRGPVFDYPNPQPPRPQQWRYSAAKLITPLDFRNDYTLPISPAAYVLSFKSLGFNYQFVGNYFIDRAPPYLLRFGNVEFVVRRKTADLKPPKVRSFELPYETFVRKIDPDFDKSQEQIEYEFQNRVFKADPTKRWPYDDT